MTTDNVVPQTNHWQKLKALVLDSVSSPITRRVYNLGLDEFCLVVRPGAPTRIHQGDGERLAGCAGGPRPRRGLDQRADHSSTETGGRSSLTTGYWRRSLPTGSRALKGWRPRAE